MSLATETGSWIVASTSYHVWLSAITTVTSAQTLQVQFRSTKPKICFGYGCPWHYFRTIFKCIAKKTSCAHQPHTVPIFFDPKSNSKCETKHHLKLWNTWMENNEWKVFFSLMCSYQHQPAIPTTSYSSHHLGTGSESPAPVTYQGISIYLTHYDSDPVVKAHCINTSMLGHRGYWNLYEKKYEKVIT